MARKGLSLAIGLILIASPMLASAQSYGGGGDGLIASLQQLVAILTQELDALLAERGGQYVSPTPSVCPSYQMPACINGTLVAQGNDSNGCPLPARCVQNSTIACPLYDLAACPAGETRGPGTTDANDCNVPGSCVPNSIPNICPSYQMPACINGTLVAQGNDSNGCPLPAKCVTNSIPFSCPMYQLLACTNGTYVSQGNDSNGCALPPKCVHTISPAQ